MCKSFACLMSKEACEANQKLASRAVEKVKTGEQLTDQEMSRLIVCGACKKIKGAKKAFRSLVSGLFDKIENYDEWGNDPELMAIRKREKYKRRRVRHREEIKVKSRIYRISKRIEKLKETKNESNCQEGNREGNQAWGKG